jgi:HK97 family phage major capsid protein
MIAREREFVAKEVAAIKDHIQATVDRGTQPLREELDRMTATVQQALAAQREMRRSQLQASLSLLNGKERPRVPFGKYAGMTPLDMAIIASIYKAQPPRVEGSPAYAQMYQDWGQTLKAAMDSTAAAAGDELVSTQEARELWMDVNLETAVAALISRIDMPSNPFDIPLQLGDVNWYPGTENVATKSTNLATKKQTLTAYELVAEVPWSLTLDEDSVIAMMDEVRRSLVRNAAEVIDDVLLNADTTVTNGINSDGATIAATDAGKGHWLLGFDGLIHLPLVDNTAQSTNLAGAITEAAFNKNRLLAARFGVRPSEAVYVMDLNTFIAAQTLTNIRTLDKFGPQATIFTGQLGAMEGIPIIVSEQMKLADTDGKVTDAGNGTNTGRLLLFNRSQWRVGFRRQLTIETTRDIQKRQNIMVVSFRIALQEGSGTRSTAKHTSLQYNITGVT